MIVAVTQISSRHSISDYDPGKITLDPIKVAVGDVVQLLVSSRSFQQLYAYVSDNRVIGQTDRQGEVVHTPAINWVFQFKAVGEGTSSIEIKDASLSLVSTYEITVAETLQTPDSPRYRVTFKMPAPEVSWSAQLGDQQSPLTEASSISFVGVPDGVYDFTLTVKNSGGVEGGAVTVNGHDVEVRADVHSF